MSHFHVFNINSMASIIGIIGVFLVVTTYFLLQLNKLKPSVTYSSLNFIGSSLILFSLFFAWNLPAVVIQVCWILISIYGIFKSIFAEKKL